MHCVVLMMDTVHVRMTVSTISLQFFIQKLFFFLFLSQVVLYSPCNEHTDDETSKPDDMHWYRKDSELHDGRSRAQTSDSPAQAKTRSSND